MTIPSVFCSIRVSSPESRTQLPMSEEPPLSRSFWIKRSALISESTSVNWKKRKAPRPVSRICLPNLPFLALVSRILAKLESTTLKIGTPTSHVLGISSPRFRQIHSPVIKSDLLPKVPSPTKRNTVVSEKVSACIVENLVTFATNVPRNPNRNQSRPLAVTEPRPLYSKKLQVVRKTPSPK